MMIQRFVSKGMLGELRSGGRSRARQEFPLTDCLQKESLT